MTRAGQLATRYHLGEAGLARGATASARGLVLALCLAILACPPHAYAALGLGPDSVEADRAHLTARLSSRAAATHVVRTLTLANGGVVREFVRPDGVVFAVAWRGPGRPDLRQLLGSRFDTLQSVAAPGRARRTRRSMIVNQADFIVRSNGHPGGFWGMAYLPQEAPAGFATKDLQ